MRKIQRSDVVDFHTWSDDVRPTLVDEVMAAKRDRRVRIEPHLTFLFENTLTMRWQVQEMMRVERIVKEASIRHEIDTYNELLADRGEIACTLLIEIVDKELRDRTLPQWLGLLDALYLELADDSRVVAAFDPMQMGEGRLSSVQYLRFDVGGRVPVALGSTFAAHAGRVELSEATRAALQVDLSLR